jgi:hypothetical protein
MTSVLERVQGNDVYNVATAAPFSNTPGLVNVTFHNPFANCFYFCCYRILVGPASCFHCALGKGNSLQKEEGTATKLKRKRKAAAR